MTLLRNHVNPLVYTYLLLCLYHLHHIAAFSFQPTTQTNPLPVADVHRQYANLPEGKHVEEHVSVDVVVQEIKPISPRLVFLRAMDATSNNNSDNQAILELLLRERDHYLNTTDIGQIVEALSAHPGSTLHGRGFPERLSIFDGPSFFPHVKPLPAQPVCLHLVAANVTLPNGKLWPLCPTEKSTPPPPILPGGRMPPFLHSTPRTKSSGSRGGGGNRDRGGILAAWAMEKFGLEPGQHSLLDIAGGSGQLAFQLSVRRGFNVTVVDPRELRLSPDQQRTLHYHRTTGLRVLPGERNRSLPVWDYGHHFGEPIMATERNTTHERTFWVGGGAQVRHLQLYLDPQFPSHQPVTWKDCSVVLGMHPDEATEDLVDLALAHDKPFAVVPCCVFWKRDPHRTTPGGKPVRTWEQLCDYLEAKDGRIQRETLPFPGRNIVLYSTGRRSDPL
jgi:hypothetical protein